MKRKAKKGDYIRVKSPKCLNHLVGIITAYKIGQRYIVYANRGYYCVDVLNETKYNPRLNLYSYEFDVITKDEAMIECL